MTLYPYPEQAAKAEGFAPHAQNDTYGGAYVIKSWEEELTLNTGATTKDTTAVLPANCLVLAVLATVSTTITTSAEWCLGISGSPLVFGAKNTTMTAGELSDAVSGMLGYPILADTAVRVTLNANPGAGKVRITAVYAVLNYPSAS